MAEQAGVSVSAIPTSLAASDGSYPGITGILFDPAIGGAVGGVTQTIFASSYGNGAYESTNGGSTWTHLTGGPTDVDYAAVSSTGVYYAVGNSNSALWSYANNTWTQLLTGAGMSGVAVDPLNPNEIVAQYYEGQIQISYNAGTTWSGSSNDVLTSADIPWLAAACSPPGYTYITVGGLAFSQTTPNELISSAGTGVWNAANLPTAITAGSSPNVTWSDMTVGIENLVANELIVPTSGHPVLASWDRPFFYVSNPNVYPSTYSPANANMNEGWSVDYASSDPNFVVGIADWYGYQEASGYSTNGGQTWTSFSADTKATSSWAAGTTTISVPAGLSINAGTLVQDLSKTGESPTATAAWTTSSTTIRVSNAAGILAGQYVYDLTTGQNLIGQVQSYSGATITLKAAAAAASAAGGDSLYIGGSNFALGTVQSYSGTTLTLTAPTSTPSNTSGDILQFGGIPGINIGGTIAASTPQNIVWAPSGKQPYYTTNGGTSWNPITLPGVTSWSGFDWAYYLDQRSVTADRVLANTFYLYYPGQGVF